MISEWGRDDSVAEPSQVVELSDTTEFSKLKESLTALLQRSSRINSAKPRRYWYPLSVATYDASEIIAAVESMCSFQTTMWDRTREFEARFGEMVAVPEAVMTNSGSSANLLISFAAVNPECELLQPGDEVLTPAMTWPTQIWPLMMAGLKPIFVDCDPGTLNMDLHDLESKITGRTRAIAAVHLMGNPLDMKRLQEFRTRHNLVLIEDCCEALGARFGGKHVGGFGDMASFSFFFSHHITTMEGGMACCRDEPLSDLLRVMRAHGWTRNAKYLDVPADDWKSGYRFYNWGFNVRPLEVQAGFGLVQLERMPQFHARRTANVRYILEGLGGYEDALRAPVVHPSAECSWFALPFSVAKEVGFTRDDVVRFLENEGIETRPLVCGLLAKHRVADVFPELKRTDLPGARRVDEDSFYIGVHPLDETATLDRLIETMLKFLTKHAGK